MVVDRLSKARVWQDRERQDEKEEAQRSVHTEARKKDQRHGLELERQDASIEERQRLLKNTEKSPPTGAVPSGGGHDSAVEFVLSIRRERTRHRASA